jgi:hypothetical protein
MRKAPVVFGSGTVDNVATANGALCAASTSNHLGPNSTGDLAKLSDSKVGVVDQMQQEADRGNCVSLVRANEGAIALMFVAHLGKAHSAWSKQEGMKF